MLIHWTIRPFVSLVQMMMMMHAKTDSEGTSLAPSSPSRQPQQQIYYVQSPSHDDGDRKTTATTTASFHSTPMGSPAAASAHHSRHSSSSSTRFSASLKPSSAATPNAKARCQRKDYAAVIEEEGLLEDSHPSSKPLSRPCCYLLAFFLLFSLFSLILWAVSKAQKPSIAMKSFKFESFTVQAGSDSSGVATDMISLNSTLNFTFRNSATFFGLHVSSAPLHLSFNQITIASGSINKFYQSRKSQRSVVVSVIGNKIPLYGGGASLGPSPAASPVAMQLTLLLRSRAYVLGRLVMPSFDTNAQCSISFHPNNHNAVTHLNNSCRT